MKQTRYFVKSAAILLAIAFSAGCSLVDLDEPNELDLIEAPIGLPSTQEELVNAIAGESGKSWETLTFKLEGLDGFQFCRLDDTFMFFSNGTYRYDGGEMLCGGEDNLRVKTGTWEIKFDTKEIIFDRTTNKEHSTQIVGIEDGKMLLRGQVEIFGIALDIEGIYQATL